MIASISWPQFAWDPTTTDFKIRRRFWRCDYLPRNNVTNKICAASLIYPSNDVQRLSRFQDWNKPLAATHLKTTARCKQYWNERWCVVLSQKTRTSINRNRKLVPQYDRCLNFGEDCVQKWRDRRTIKYKLLLIVWDYRTQNTSIVNLLYQEKGKR